MTFDSKQYYLENKEKKIRYQKEYRLKNQEQIKRKKREKYLKNKANGNYRDYYLKTRFRKKENHMLKNYNINLKEYNIILEKQNNRCVICKKSFDTMVKPCVDHNHLTNKVREILCSKCNTALGFLNEDLQIVNNLYNYIKKHNYNA